ncbi:MAG: response regulator, partial [Planctomycetales bacterium]|nr:response regulator [Planctomycetales bacterium]
GKGSTFTATIVARQVPGAGSIQPGTEFSDAEPIKVISEISLTCHVLVVDDRREIRFLTRKLLNKAGATVSEAEDGSAAVALVQSAMSNGSPPDLILLDMQMPRMDGYETAIQLRKLGFTSPIVALTADAMQGDMARCIESGCNAYVSKPIDRDTLIGAVHRFTTQ